MDNKIVLFTTKSAPMIEAFQGEDLTFQNCCLQTTIGEKNASPWSNLANMGED